MCTYPANPLCLPGSNFLSALQFTILFASIPLILRPSEEKAVERKMSYFFLAPILFPLQTAASIQANLQSLVFCRVGSASAAGHSGIQISSAAAINITD